jgi:hypothetical protein
MYVYIIINIVIYYNVEALIITARALNSCNVK